MLIKPTVLISFCQPCTNTVISGERVSLGEGLLWQGVPRVSLKAFSGLTTDIGRPKLLWELPPLDRCPGLCKKAVWASHKKQTIEKENFFTVPTSVSASSSSMNFLSVMGLSIRWDKPLILQSCFGPQLITATENQTGHSHPSVTSTDPKWNWQGNQNRI